MAVKQLVTRQLIISEFLKCEAIKLDLILFPQIIYSSPCRYFLKQKNLIQILQTCLIFIQ